MAPTPTDVHHRTNDQGSPSESGDVTTRKTRDARAKLVAINGNWYDVTSFIDRHPGGEILKHFIGEDATSAFMSIRHPPYALERMKVVESYEVKVKHPADEEFVRLAKYFAKDGYFTTNWRFYAQKVCVCALFFAAMLACVLVFTAPWIHYAGAVMLALTWQQCGFITHDAMHTQLFRRARIDHRVGVFFGTVVFGMSAHWWRDEHRVHHVLTNTVDVARRFADPQMWEDSWAQHEKLFPLFKGYLAYVLIKIQHVTFVPAVMIFGRFVILVESYVPERRPVELFGIALHWVWMICLLSHLPCWTEVLIFYFIAAAIEGIFHFQLILSHYCKMFFTIDEHHISSWYVTQVMSNMNIDCPWWLDWYYGGLNYHIEHHLFPTMARDRLSKAVPFVKDICRRHRIPYDSAPFSTCFAMTLRHLKKTASHYTLNPA